MVIEMPFYDYKCSDCGHVFEVGHPVDQNADACEKCGGSVKRLFHPVGIIFKGSGFYATDYKSGKSGHAQQAGGNGNDSSKESETDSSSSTASSESKEEKNKKADSAPARAKPDTST